MSVVNECMSENKNKREYKEMFGANKRNIYDEKYMKNK